MPEARLAGLLGIQVHICSMFYLFILISFLFRLWQGTRPQSNNGRPVSVGKLLILSQQLSYIFSYKKIMLNSYCYSLLSYINCSEISHVVSLQYGGYNRNSGLSAFDLLCRSIIYFIVDLAWVRPLWYTTMSYVFFLANM